MIMRFLSAKSPREGRRACVFLMLVLMFLAAVAVSNAGWIGKAMVAAGLLPQDTDPQQVFVKVAAAVCQPGIFGFVMAALTAALMSTADTLLNATSAIAVNDIYRPYIRPRADDKHYLVAARVVAIASAMIGLASVPLFASFKSIYRAHGAFTATTTPPMAAAVMLGAFWKRFNTAGALAAILGGAVCIVLSLVEPEVIRPFSFGVPKGGEHMHAWVYQRALFGLACSMGIGIIVTLLTPAPRLESISGTVWGTLDIARQRFKGGAPNLEPGRVIKLEVELTEAAKTAETPEQTDDYRVPRFERVQIAEADRSRMKALPGDIIQLSHTNWIYGGLRSVQVKIDDSEDVRGGHVRVSRSLLESSGLRGVTRLRVEKIL
jgi:SSS family solute:Na+ symporter